MSYWCPKAILVEAVSNISKYFTFAEGTQVAGSAQACGQRRISFVKSGMEGVK